MFANQDARYLIEVRESPGKGVGIFAKDNIPRGTRILAESCLLKVENDEPNAKSIVQAFESLAPSQQSSYLQLYAYTFDSDKQILEGQMGQTWDEMPELHRKVLNIYTANSFPSVFLLGSRFNHSCLPNTTHSYNPALDKETFHTIRDITAGEELFITYINGSNWIRSQRQEYLQKWGFQCNCLACEDTPEARAKEEKRLELSYLGDELEDLLNLDTEESPEEALKLTQKLAAIQKAEGLVGRELCYSYYYAAKVNTRLGNARMALLWAEKGLEVDRYCVGEDHPEFITTLEAFRRLRAALDKVTGFDDRMSTYLRNLPSVSKNLI